MVGRRAFLASAASRGPWIGAVLAAAATSTDGCGARTAAAWNAVRSALSPVPVLRGAIQPAAGDRSQGAPLTIDGGELLPWNALEHGYLGASGIRLLPVHPAVSSGTVQFPSGMGTIPDNAKPDVLTIEIIPWTWSGLGGRALGALMRAANFDASSVDADRMGALSLSGHQYGVPFSAVPVAVFYNPALLEAAGVSAPAPGWTLDALVQACHELRAGLPGGTPPLDGVPTGGLMIWAALVAGYRGSFLDGEGRVPSWDAGVEAALSTYITLKGFGFIGRSATGGEAVPATAALGPAMWFALFQPPDWASVRAGTIGVAGFPRAPAGRFVPHFPLGHAIGGGTPDPLRSLDFLAWLLSPDGQRLVTAQGWLPARRDLAASTAWFAAPPGPRLDAAALLVPEAQRWWAAPVLWSATAGQAAQAVSALGPHSTPAEVRTAWQTLQGAVDEWNGQPLFQQSLSYPYDIQLSALPSGGCGCAG